MHEINKIKSMNSDKLYALCSSETHKDVVQASKAMTSYYLKEHLKTRVSFDIIFLHNSMSHLHNTMICFCI